jgi:transcriptional antiterminator
MIDGPHLVRLVKLCKLLGSADGMTLQQLRSKLKTSRRTVFRELKWLQQFTIPVRRAHRRYHVRMKLSECRKRIEAAQVLALRRLLDACAR